MRKLDATQVQARSAERPTAFKPMGDEFDPRIAHQEMLLVEPMVLQSASHAGLSLMAVRRMWEAHMGLIRLHDF